jgi:hypothetical protein
MKLTLCPRCHRHVKASDPCCPFCSAPVASTLGPSIGAAVVLGLVLTACPNTLVAYGPPIYDRDGGPGGAHDAAAGDAGNDAIQPPRVCPDKTAVEEYGGCAAADVGMTCPGTADRCGHTLSTDCTCRSSTPHTWFCGEWSCPNSGTGSGPGADASSGKDAAKAPPDAMSGVMYGPATGDW